MDRPETVGLASVLLLRCVTPDSMSVQELKQPLMWSTPAELDSR